MEPTHGDYRISDVQGYDRLADTIAAINRMESHDRRVTALADLLMSGHKGVSGYLTFGNNKVADNTGIFNMNSATDCPNADTTVENQSDTGVCQVPWAACYAHQSENIYPDALKKRRLQEYLWDAFGADMWADAFTQVKSRKRSAFDYLRVSESGDFRHNGDIAKWNQIATELAGSIRVYTYSASHKLDWNEYNTSQNFVVNASNDLADYGARQFTATYKDADGTEHAIEETDDVPDEMITCPFEAAKANGVDTENRPQCGECTHCIEPASEQDKDVAVIQH
jgi:hypothetical protein